MESTTETTQPLQQLENEVLKWLLDRGLIAPCPFTERLDSQAKAKWLRQLTRQLGHRYGTCTLDNFKADDHPAKAKALARLKRFATAMPDYLKGGGGLILFGHPGTGKDHLLAALCRLAVGMHGLSAYWTDGGDLYDRVAQAATSDDHHALKRLQCELREPHILALSDLQPPKGDISPAQARRVRDIVDRRYRDQKSTWLTSNLDTPKLFDELLTKPVMDRLREGCGIVDCCWPSYREALRANW